jgi:hypothetical protein
MFRCASLAAAGALSIALVLPVSAQMPRNFPATALRGTLQVTQPPEALLHGRPARLSPGARIRTQNNLLVVSGGLAGQRLTVNYTLDISGLLADVWVLRPEEAAKSPWPRTAEQAAKWRFDPIAQTWSRP